MISLQQNAKVSREIYLILYWLTLWVPHFGKNKRFLKTMQRTVIFQRLYTYRSKTQKTKWQNKSQIAQNFLLIHTSTSFFTSQQHHRPSYSLQVLPVSSLVKPRSPMVCMMFYSSYLPRDSYRHLFEARAGPRRNQSSAGPDRWFAGRFTSCNVLARTPFLTQM